MINSRPLYCHGVNKHEEDTDIRGRGFDRVVLARDFSLLQWLRVNCVRTSHYPYSEDFMELADMHRIAVIDELPAVGLTEDSNYSPRQLALHKCLFSELYSRDKNRSSVIMLSLANEPDSTKASAGAYFKRGVRLRARTRLDASCHVRLLESGMGQGARDEVRERDGAEPVLRVVCGRRTSRAN